MKEKFEIINASAGSGKTFTLSSNVIQRILTGKEDSYKKILALTFTNNSANEMKKRILDELRQISIDPWKSKVFLKTSLKKTFTTNQISKKAKKILNKILHNFSFFQVSTIDKFNHRLIRSFSNDLSLSYDFDLVIDQDEFMEELIKNFIEGLKKDSFLTQTIINHAKSKHSENKTWDISYDLKDLLNIIWDENNYKYLENNEMDEEDFKSLKSNLNSKKNIISKKVQKTCFSIDKKIKSRNIDLKCFSYNALPKFLNQVHLFDLKKIEYRSLNNRLLAKTLIKKGFIDSNTENLIAEINPLLNDVFNDISKYKTYANLLNNITLNYLINIISALSKKFQKENNTLLISDFNTIINENISDQPAPFIYEKIGTKFNNYFIDEFQDTSELQWKNLIPLTSHSILNEELNEEGGNLFIVGDPKQSIYRWRGAKPETFNELTKSTPFYLKPYVNNLGKNYRSHKKIVNINNRFFKYVAKQIDVLSVKSIYSELNQDYKAKNNGGYVSVNMIKSSNPKDYDIEAKKKVIKIIREKEKQGFNLSDIAILCRTNKECNSITSFLINKNLKVNSEELLALSSSKEVLFILDLIRLKINENNLQAKKNLLKYISIKKDFRNKHEFISEKIGLTLKNIINDILKIEYSFFLELDLYQSIQYVISSVDLFDSAAMQVHFLLEEIFDFSNSILSNKESFINYWERKKEKLKVNLIEETNAVKVLTIHKSKGLEFPIVILPYFDYKLSKPDRKIWIKLSDDDLKGSFLVDFDEHLKFFGTDITKIIDKNNDDMVLENINTMYVSLSRAILENHVISKESDLSSEISSGVLLNSFLLGDTGSEGKSFFEFGNTKYIKIKEKGNEKTLKKIITVVNNQKFNDINYYFSSSNKANSKFGNLFHKIMSEIEYNFQFEPVINDFFQRGLIDKSDMKRIKEYIKLILNNNKLKCFFDKKNIVYNEREILIPPDKVIIPDKTVFLDNNSISILDYKTGKKNKEHLDQMKKYIFHLKKANYRVKNAFLVYILDEIKLVEIIV